MATELETQATKPSLPSKKNVLWETVKGALTGLFISLGLNSLLNLISRDLNETFYGHKRYTTIDRSGRINYPETLNTNKEKFIVSAVGLFGVCYGGYKSYSNAIQHNQGVDKTESDQQAKWTQREDENRVTSRNRVR